MTIQVEMTELSALRRELKIEVDAAHVAEAMEHVIDGVARQARMPGFRPGKVPRPILRRRFASEIENEVLEHVVPEALGKALRDKQLAPVHQPVLRDVRLVDGQPLQFTASFEVRPKIEPENYRGVVLEEPRRHVEEADLTAELEAMREAAGVFVSAEPAPLRRGDFALLDLTRESDGETHEQKNALVEVGGEEYHPDFVANLEGTRPGEDKSFEVRYGEDDPDPEARGRVVRYGVHVHEVKRKQLPDLDDEFAKDTGRHNSLAELKAALGADLAARLQREKRRHLETQLARALAEPLAVEVPEALVEDDINYMIEEQARLLTRQGIDPRTAPIDWAGVRQKMTPTALLKVKWTLLLDAIAGKEGIEPSATDIETRFQGMAAAAGKSVDFVRSRIEKEGRMEEVRRSCRLERCVDFLIDNARMEGGRRA